MSNNRDSQMPLTKVVQIMKQPTLLLKFGMSGSPKFTNLQLELVYGTADQFQISWVSAKKDASQARVLMKNVTELRWGQRTEKFKRNLRPDLQHLSFSLCYKVEVFADGQLTTQQDTLDLVCKDEKEYQIWTSGCLALIEGRVTPDVVTAFVAASTHSDDSGGASSSGGAGRLSVSGSIEDFKNNFQGTNDVYAFGCGEWGQDGLADFSRAERSPAIVKSLLGKGVQNIACGWAHTLILLETGQIFIFGNRVGTGLSNDAFLPMPLSLPPQIKCGVTLVSCGAYHSAVVTDNGDLLTWGANTYGQLGLGHTNDVVKPTLVSAFAGNPVTLVTCGTSATAATGTNGDLFTWGCGEHGQLGHNDCTDRLTPTAVVDLQGQRISKIAIGEAHMIAASEELEVFAWGWNACGQTGQGHQEDCLRPAAIEVFRGQELLSLGAGATHSIAVTKIPLMNTRQAFGWGSNANGQLGLPEKKVHVRPQVIPLPGSASDFEPTAVSCGSHHSILLNEGSGDLYSTGNNEFGQLGHTDVGQELAEFKLIEALRGRMVRQVRCGASSTCALVARAWVEDSQAQECMGCQSTFTLLNRRHHCRHCGGIFCGDCSDKKIALLKYGEIDPVRVCRSCYMKLTKGK